MALRLKPIIKAKAKENQIKAGGAVPQKSGKAVTTNKELGKTSRRLKPIIQDKAKENQATRTGHGYQKSDKATHTAKELAKIAGVSHDTILNLKTRD